jgi:hypothetical protein
MEQETYYRYAEEAPLDEELQLPPAVNLGGVYNFADIEF